MINGIYLPTGGAFSLSSQELVGSPRDITRAGIARTFQNIRLFQNLTVLDNVRIYHTHAGYNPLESITRPARFAVRNESDRRAQDFLAVFAAGSSAQMARTCRMANSAG